MNKNDIIKFIFKDYISSTVDQQIEDECEPSELLRWQEGEFYGIDGEGLTTSFSILHLSGGDKLNKTLEAHFPDHIDFEIILSRIIDKNGIATDWYPTISYNFIYLEGRSNKLKRLVSKYGEGLFVDLDDSLKIHVDFSFKTNLDETILDAKAALTNAIYKILYIVALFYAGDDFYSPFKNIKSKDENMIIKANAVIKYDCKESHVLGEQNYLFHGPNIIKIPSGVESIERGAFSNMDMEEVILPKTVVHIGEGAFQNCKNLKIIHSLDYIDYIGRNAFYGCSSLEKIIIGKEWGHDLIIEDNAFFGCTKLSEIALLRHIDKIGKNAFNGFDYKESKRNIYFYCEKKYVSFFIKINKFYGLDSDFRNSICYYSENKNEMNTWHFKKGEIVRRQ